MTASLLIRQTHRWVSIAFVAIVAGIFTALGLGQQPAQWVYLLPLLPLLPLAVLAGTGLYLFVLPYLPGRRRSGA